MIPKPDRAFIYMCQIRRVIDGDTLEVLIDLGFRQFSVERVRLAGIDTPEIRGPQRTAGLAVARWVTGWAATLGPDFVAQTGKDSGMWGRWVADVWAPTGEHLNGQLLAEGLAKPATTARAAWTPDEIKEITER